MRMQIRVIATVALLAVRAGIAQEYEAAFSTTAAGVHAFLGTDRAKLAYVNWYDTTKALHFIDFSEGGGEPVVRRIPDAVMPTAPRISPDGEWVVYASAPGVSGETGPSSNVPSSVYLCRLTDNAQPVLIAADSAHEPRFVQSSDTLTVVYSTSGIDDAWDNHGRTMLVRIDTAGGTPVVQSRKELWAHGGYAGGLSYDGRYLCGGAGELVMMDLESGDTGPDTVTYHPLTSAVDASISSSRIHTNLVMYLDFGSYDQVYPGVNDGQPWKTWEVIIVGDNAGEIVNSFPYPRAPEHPYTFEDTTFGAPGISTGFETFDHAMWRHPEWSNHPYFAIATVNVDRQYHYAEYDNANWQDGSWQHTAWQERIVLIDLKNRDYHEVLRRGDCCYLDELGKGFYWPSLWVEVASDFAEEEDWVGTRRCHAGGHAAHGLRFTRGVVVSDRPLKQVTVHDLLGRRLGAASLRSGQRRVSVASLLNAGGMFVVRATDGALTRAWCVSSASTGGTDTR